MPGNDVCQQREEACLRALCRGADAWGEFFDIFGQTITYELTRFDPRKGLDREDILQDLIVKLMQHDCDIIQRFLERASGLSFRVVLRTMVYCVGVDYCRRRKRFQRFAGADEAPAIAALAERTWAVDPARRLYREVRLACALSEVTREADNPQAYRILYLRYVEGWAVKEIAREMQLPENTVSQRIRYYLPRLRQVIRLRGFGDED